jgi:hypothetical protein
MIVEVFLEGATSAAPDAPVYANGEEVGRVVTVDEGGIATLSIDGDFLFDTGELRVSLGGRAG